MITIVNRTLSKAVTPEEPGDGMMTKTANGKPHLEDIAGGQAIIEGVMMRYGNKIAAQ
jgi:hypothetical protein